MKTLSIKVFGRLTVSDESGEILAVTGKKRQALLVYLCLNQGRSSSREDLMALLCGERFEDQARQSLRECISRLRKTLGGDDGPLRADRNHVWLQREAVQVDAQTLSQLAHLAAAEMPVQPAQLVATAGLYGGPLLADMKAQNGTFDEWLRAERIRYNEAAVGVLDRLANMTLSASDINAAIQLAHRTLAFDSLNERAHLALMQVHLQAGEPGAAIQQYRACAKILRDELQVDPGARIKALYEQINSSGAKADVAAVAGPPADPVSICYQYKYPLHAPRNGLGCVVQCNHATVTMLPLTQVVSYFLSNLPLMVSIFSQARTASSILSTVKVRS